MCMSTVKFRHYFLNMTRVVRTNDLKYRNVEIVSAIVNIWGHIFILIITINSNVKREERRRGGGKEEEENTCRNTTQNRRPQSTASTLEHRSPRYKLENNLPDT